VIFSSELEAKIRSRGVIENLLRTSEFGAEMALVFQPIVDAMSEHTAGFEVLARWNSPRLDPVSPADFIPTAERIGLVRPLRQALLVRALATAKSWPEHIRLSFNLSAHDVWAAEGILQLISIIEKAAPDRFRDHRDRRHLRFRARAAIDRDAEGHGLRHFAGQFRHRLFVAEPRAPPAARQDQGRSQLRLRYQRESGQPQDHQVAHGPVRR
jgi:hypothetical protein